MKFDKDIVIGLLICALVLLGWDPFCRFMGWTAPLKSNTPAAAPATPAASATAQSPAHPSPAGTSQPQPPAETLAIPQPLPEQPAVILENQDLRLTLSPNSGAAESITLKDYLTADRQKPVVIDQTPSAKLAATSLQPGALGIFAPGEKWQTVATSQNHLAEADIFQLTRTIYAPGHGSFHITQKWRLSSGYATDYEVTLSNPGVAALHFPRLVISDGELQQWGAISGDKMRSDSLRLDYLTAGGELENLSADGKDSKFFQSHQEQVTWVALSNKYFISILLGEHPFRLYQARVAASEPHSFVVTTGAEYSDVHIPPSGSITWKFRFYAGPKIAANLNAFAPDAGRTMHLAWGPLDYLARWMLWALIQLKHLCGSYGWSIILLTIIVRLVFWPVTARANASMKKMSAVQPKIQALRTQYKDNPQLLNTKMMELYRTEKINPLGGCLPILLQIPVFFALYATLDGAVELRQVSFLWAHDLAAADTVARVFGLPINPLVLAMTGLMVLQQRLTPSAMDPMQQKMMLAMPIVMLFFLYDLPSGLTLYWTVSQIFSILQLLLQQKFNPKTAAPTASPSR